jgi:transcriptional regulator with XRE-family HTH domain
MRRSAQMGAFMKKEINVEIGGRIRRQREALHMSREQLAEAADISTPFLADVELGRKGVSPLTIRKMCNALHVSADYLIRNKELSSDFPEIIELLSSLEPRYLPLVEELLRVYIKAIDLKEGD